MTDQLGDREMDLDSDTRHLVEHYRQVMRETLETEPFTLPTQGSPVNDMQRSALMGVLALLGNHVRGDWDGPVTASAESMSWMLDEARAFIDSLENSLLSAGSPQDKGSESSERSEVCTPPQSPRLPYGLEGDVTPEYERKLAAKRARKLRAITEEKKKKQEEQQSPQHEPEKNVAEAGNRKRKAL